MKAAPACSPQEQTDALLSSLLLCPLQIPAQATLAQRALMKIPSRVAAHPARAEFACVGHLADATKVAIMYAAVILSDAALDAFLVMSSK